MELAQGGSLLDYVRQRKRLAEPEACFFLQQIVHGLMHCHDMEVWPLPALLSVLYSSRPSSLTRPNCNTVIMQPCNVKSRRKSKGWAYEHYIGSVTTQAASILEVWIKNFKLENLLLDTSCLAMLRHHVWVTPLCLHCKAYLLYRSRLSCMVFCCFTNGFRA